jgi:hypothetical protein
LQRDRSYVRLQVCVEPEEDLHLFGQARFQTRVAAVSDRRPRILRALRRSESAATAN